MTTPDDTPGERYDRRLLASAYRKQYQREYQKKRLAGLHNITVDDIGPVAFQLLTNYRKQSGLHLKAIVTDALIAYLTPKVK